VQRAKNCFWELIAGGGSAGGTVATGERGDASIKSKRDSVRQRELEEKKKREKCAPNTVRTNIWAIQTARNMGGL